MATQVPPEFTVNINDRKCARCKRCVDECGFEALTYSKEYHEIIADDAKCVACHRCATMCPKHAIRIEDNALAYKYNANFSAQHRKNILKQAETGGILLTAMGCDQPYPILWDHMLIDACQVTNPPIDPLREPMELRTYIGRKPAWLEFDGEAGLPRLRTEMAQNLKLDFPIVFGGMSYGSVSYNVHKSLMLAAERTGILMNTGEGGLHQDLYQHRNSVIVQCASGRFGVHAEYLNDGAAIEIKIGQGAKPGIGGHLPGEKVSEDISRTRMIPKGTDALSPAPHHDIYSIEDLGQLIFALKEASRYKKPVGVKVAAVHNIAAICSGIVRAGADFVTIDGFRGGTGAAPRIIRDNVGIPVELAIAAVDDRLRQEGIRNQASILCGGGIRQSADMIKAIALGADAVVIGTSALVALGCRVCQKCNTGKCSWGIATQNPKLTARLDPEEGAQRLTNLIHAWGHEMEEVLGALGVNSIESLRGSRERLRGIGLDEKTLNILGIKPAGR
ncbi:glutamate synthase-related protein [Methanocella arvoryzae]|uniref:Archaeal glutamate synthase [NADPH] n=1 Tax=Methanocella arvoryzae (strain DSM 22066 / NBRC 105507 / MRE50) TaxID=351160 RepID=Q0W7S6_METAR|nr:glutamate synthase-related protein [Methanocella arvoryzae]CAJ35567.1 NADPH-dependent glutamate synthase, large subunit domain 2 [Methanocella arvoryzae MRE50]